MFALPLATACAAMLFMLRDVQTQANGTGHALAAEKDVEKGAPPLPVSFPPSASGQPSNHDGSLILQPSTIRTTP